MSDFWNSISQFHDEIISFPIGLVLAFTIYTFRPKVNLIWGQANNSFHRLQDENTEVEVYTDKIFVQNLGKLQATKIEIVYSQKPDEFSLFQEREFDVTQNPNGNFIIKIPCLAPKELLIVDTIYLHGNPARIITINCAETISNKVDFNVSRRFSWPINFLIASLMFLGLLFPISLLLQIILNY